MEVDNCVQWRIFDFRLHLDPSEARGIGFSEIMDPIESYIIAFANEPLPRQLLSLHHVISERI